MWWLLIIVLISVLLVTLFWMPMRLIVDSPKNHYSFQWGHLLQARLIPEKNRWFAEWSVLGWRHRIDLIKSLAQPLKDQPKDVPKKEKKKTHRWRIRRLPMRLFNIARTFRVRTFHLDLDTGDVVYNAFLIPVFTGIRQAGGDVRINYSGRISLNLCLESRLIRMARAFLLH